MPSAAGSRFSYAKAVDSSLPVANRSRAPALGSNVASCSHGKVTALWSVSARME